MTRLSLRNVTKKCPNNDMVVKNFSLDIEDNEFVVLAGPAGCGKTLLIRMIAGLEESNSGDICIDGELVNDRETKDRGVAMVFQNYALYPSMNVRDNIAFALKLGRMAQEEIDERIRRTAEFMGMEALLDRMPESLSEEETLQAVIARAVVKEPKVFLMDDPLVRIDKEKRQMIEEKMTELCRKMGIPFVYATQSQEEAMDMATRIVVMNEGEIQQEGTPEELYANPANSFTAFFIGEPHINMVQAAVVENQGQVLLRFGESEVLLPENQASVLKEKKYIGKYVFMGIRPENVFLAEKAEESHVCQGEADRYEKRGTCSFLYVSAGENTWILPENEEKFQPGDTVNLAFDTKKLHIFCAETGEAIG